jgi:hypothetical protein
MAIARPDRMFALFALVGGLLLAILLPPGLGGNETLNLRRIAALAAGEMLVRPVAVPGGIVRFLDQMDRRFPDGAAPPFGYGAQDWRNAAGIALDAAHPAVLAPNPIAVLHPISYLPQVPAFWLGQRVGLPPVALLYLCRLAGLLAGVGLTMLAVRQMPRHASLLAAIALLPTLLYQRSVVDADQFTVALALLFGAMLLRDALASGAIAPRRLCWLGGMAFLLAQAKSAYLLLPLAAVAIPAARFASPRQRWAWLAVIILPGLACSLAWMVALKASYFAGIRYVTWSGVVDPDAQLQGMLAEPLGYIAVLARTLLSGPFLAQLVLGPVGIIGPGVALAPWLFALLLLALAGLAASAPAAPPIARALRWIAGGIALATLGLILSLLYLQWTQAGGAVVDGFQGRYLLPLAPLLLALLPAGGARLPQPLAPWLSPPRLLAGIGLFSVAGTLQAAWAAFVAPRAVPFLF